MTEKKICLPFFFRRVNDLRQFLPIIDFLKKKNHILLISLNKDFEINSYEPLYQYKNHSNIEIYHIYDFLCQKNFFLKYLYHLCEKFIFLTKFKSFFRKLLLSKNNLKKILNRYKIKQAIFDFPISNQNYRNLVTLISSFNVKIIGIHHGIWVRFTDLKKKRYKNFFLSQKKNSEIYDKIVVFNPDFKKNLEKLGCKNKFIFFGSFYDKWKKFKLQRSNKNNPIKILYLDHSSKHGIIKINVVKDIVKIKKLKNVQIKIRPNTSIEFSKNKQDLDLFYKYGLDQNLTYNDTSKLIQESDIIINPISSAIIEAFYFKKIVIHPKHYLKDDYLLWQKFKCCYEVKNTKEILRVINLFKTNKLKKKDYLKNCRKFLLFLNGKKNIKHKLNLLCETIIKDF
tara:strand:+ start:895 stop:2085 length:1191 start_codon:yes stop_codon:yes gene_type:complete